MMIISPLVRYPRVAPRKSSLTIHKGNFAVEVPVTGIKNDGCIKKSFCALLAKEDLQGLKARGCKVLGGGRLAS